MAKVTMNLGPPAPSPATLFQLDPARAGLGANTPAGAPAVQVHGA